MDLEQYQSLSGVDVADTRTQLVSANASKARSMLEAALGFSLDPAVATKNLYTETGKTATDYWDCGNANLLPPDDEPNASYRVFSFQRMDPFVLMDPAASARRLKLVHGTVTLHTVEASDLSLRLH